MKKARNIVVNGLNIEMLDVRANLRFGDLEHLERLCNTLSTAADYRELWNYVVVKPKWDEIIPAEQYISEELRVSFQKIILPVLLPVIGYSHVPAFRAVEQLQQEIDKGWLGSPAIPLSFMRGSGISRFLHLVRFIGMNYPDLARGLSRASESEWRTIEKYAHIDDFPFEGTDYRNYIPDIGKSPQPKEMLLPVWIRHRLAHPENKYEQGFPTESDYRRAFAILGAAIAGKTYSGLSGKAKTEHCGDV